ncbi:MAG: PorV/PorQ family protein [Ignavibacteria bacterium]|nr:PorV/PorQ family protein [Ignavibacteria bacterium]
MNRIVRHDLDIRRTVMNTESRTGRTDRIPFVSPLLVHAVPAVFVLLLLAAACAVAGGGDRKGTAAADQLLVPVGARGIALGSSCVAGISGVNALYYNPAGLAATPHSVDAMFSQTSSFDNDGISTAAIGVRFEGFGHIGLSIKAFSFADIPYTDERNPDGSGAVYSPTFVSVGITYARALTDRIRAGLTTHLVSEELNRVSAFGVAFDIGLQYHGLAGIQGLQLGVALKHLGGNMQYDGPGLYRNVNEIGSDRTGQMLKIEAAGSQLPTSLELGLGYATVLAADHSLSFSSSFENNNFLNDSYRLGIEYGFKDMLYLRASWSLAGDDKADVFGEKSYIFGPAIGAGVRQDAGGLLLSFDYAYRSSDVFAGNHVFTLGASF